MTAGQAPKKTQGNLTDPSERLFTLTETVGTRFSKSGNVSLLD